MALLPALILSAVAAYGGVLLGAQSSLPAAAWGPQCNISNIHHSPSHEWTANRADDDSDTADDEDGGNDDAPDAMPAPASTILTPDRGQTRLPVYSESDQPSCLKMDGHLLRGPPQPAHGDVPVAIPGVLLPSDRDGDTLDDNDDEDDDAPASLMGPVPASLSDSSHSQLFTSPCAGRRSFVSSLSLRAPPQ